MAADKTQPPISKPGRNLGLINLLAPVLAQQMIGHSSGLFKDAGFGIDFPITAGEDYETEGMTTYSPGRVVTDMPGSFYNPPMSTYLPVNNPEAEWYGTGIYHDEPMSRYSFKPELTPYETNQMEMMRKLKTGAPAKGLWDDASPIGEGANFYGTGPLNDLLKY